LHVSIQRKYTNHWCAAEEQRKYSDCRQQQLSPTQISQFTTMTRSAEEVLRAETVDLKLLVEYIKIDLFPKAKFVLGKDEWDVGGTIYGDYIKCCKGRIGLQTMTEVERERHMEKIWMRALNKKVQQKALVQKRSAIYTVMQNKFAGNLHCLSV
jgi:hypothetical protein